MWPLTCRLVCFSESICPRPAASFSTWRPIISSLKVWYCLSVSTGSQKLGGLHCRLGERSTLFDFHKGYYLYVFINCRFLITYLGWWDGARLRTHRHIYAICIYFFVLPFESLLLMSHVWCIKFRWEEDCWGQSWSRCERRNQELNQSVSLRAVGCLLKRHRGVTPPHPCSFPSSLIFFFFGAFPSFFSSFTGILSTSTLSS